MAEEQNVLQFSSRPARHINDGGYLKIYRRMFGKSGDATLGTDRRMIGAWIEMLCAATWELEGRDVRVGGTWIRLQYGQLIMNYRVLGKQWSIPHTTLFSACQRMERSGRLVIETRPVNAGKQRKATVATIRNFGLYQLGIDPAADRALPVSYVEYLQSPAWQGTRKRALKRAKDRCQVCNSPNLLQVHHRTYERLGKEAPGDLLVLCDGCHDLFHSHGRLA
jgi:hypothetical protein